MGTILVSLPRLTFQLGIISVRKYIKFLPKVRGGAQRAEGSVVFGQLLYYCLLLYMPQRTQQTCEWEDQSNEQAKGLSLACSFFQLDNIGVLCVTPRPLREKIQYRMSI